ncbi:hypothetical protein C2L64_23800 [Paraburkholderia hospita]|uniref:Uncharacterized protein n=1 Tax=Paraburkholderia hospita TaxID=169430 RepID=A0AAN1JDI2_9BURK|nr:hypothetical protein C2L64_23800 [Paraburkholderia hospita]
MTLTMRCVASIASASNHVAHAREMSFEPGHEPLFFICNLLMLLLSSPMAEALALACALQT